MGPLAGLRVVEIAGGVAGPHCGMQLADAGAEVTKLEPPEGDPARGWGPPASGDDSAVFVALNRNKASVVVDFNDAGAERRAHALLSAADVVIADVQRLPAAWLGYEATAIINPRLIYIAISGWGARGPWRDWPGSELAAQLAAEVTTGLGRPGEPPVRFAVDLAGAYTGVFAVQAVCAALIERGRSGQGQRVDLSLFGSLMFARTEMWVAMSEQDSWGGTFLENDLVPPMHGYRCKDGYIYCSFARVSPKGRQELIELLGMEWVRDEPLYEIWLADRAAHVGPNAQRVHPLWERGFASFTRAELIAIIEGLGGEAVAKNDYASFIEDAQVRHMRIIRDVTAAGGEAMRAVAPPWSFSDTPAREPGLSPRLGQHTAEILGSSGH